LAAVTSDLICALSLIASKSFAPFSPGLVKMSSQHNCGFPQPLLSSVAVSMAPHSSAF